MAEGMRGQREEERCVLTRQESQRANCTLETLANPLLSHTSDHEGGAPWLAYFLPLILQRGGSFQMQCRGAQSNEQVCKLRFLDKERTAWFNTSSSEMVHRNTPTLVSQGHSVLLDHSMKLGKRQECSLHHLP